jgi:hypothetical protein
MKKIKLIVILAVCTLSFISCATSSRSKMRNGGGCGCLDHSENMYNNHSVDIVQNNRA